MQSIKSLAKIEGMKTAANNVTARPALYLENETHPMLKGTQFAELTGFAAEYAAHLMWTVPSLAKKLHPMEIHELIASGAHEE